MIIKPTDEAIRNAAEELRAGKLVAFPTETVYGLGADPFNAEAVRKIYTLKGRPSTNPLIVHLAGMHQLADVAVVSNVEILNKLSAACWPGPLSIVLERQARVCAEVSGGHDTVAVRVPNHPVALRLLRRFGPIAAPSANRSNCVSPTTAAHVEAEFGGEIKSILDGGPCEIGIESTVLSLVHAQPAILRSGFYTREQLEKIIGIGIATQEHSAAGPKISPGMLEKHYSPHTALCFADQMSSQDSSKKIGLLRFGPEPIPLPYALFTVKNLSPDSNLEVAAHNLYFMLRELDGMGLDLIVVERCPRVGIGAAIMDRLERAARQSHKIVK